MNLLTQEQKILPALWAVTLACSVTGAATFFINNHTVWIQWSVLVHIVTGVACSLGLLFFLVSHFRRTIAFRRIRVFTSGLLILFIFIAFSYTGWYLLFLGQKESEHWVYLTHIISSGLFIVFLALHLFLHRFLLPQRRRESAEPKFPSIIHGTSKVVLWFNVAIVGLIIGLSVVYQYSLKAYSTQPQVDNYELPYGPHPFRPSQTESATNTFIDKRQIGNSHKCLACHEDIGRQWVASVHKEAASDPTYVTNIKTLVNSKGITATRYCEGCHAPVALLSGELSPGGKHGAVSDTMANQEGVSCLGCHGINKLVHLKGVASYQFKPKQDYLFAQSNNEWLTRLNNLLIRVKPDQHIKDLGKPLFKESKYCSTCHSQFMDKDMNDWGWVKMQDEYGQWLESPFSNQHQENFSDANVSRCQDCHMPLVESSDPSADKNGKIRSHHYPAANTLLPTLRGDKEQLAAVKSFLQANKLRVSIDKPSRQNALQTLHAVDERLRDSSEAPYYYYLGEQAKINIIVSNQGVGHSFPGGTIDINQAWLEFIVVDAQGRDVFASGLIDSNNFVDKKAHFYRSLPVDKQGRLVWKHDLFNRVGESFKRVIKAGESDLVAYEFALPSWVKSPITLTATLKYRKLNERYARWALKDKYVTIPVVNMAWDSLSIPVKIRQEVEDNSQ
ncbi:multiheme c-type cytochrome [Psychrobium sp. 1_MG-2023]|uniref:multiheme c-type cytochrome n=1 Tax=Psychrobium sp. 1_MG-2023 TaxID=3062624 RepID=UPI002732C616|nr:multiheme c-type cytochrome [Psychrobium sp. 1_MG-2023]MDP2560632.1 multiheme c-type cytochrome [Psychrobium sp. 1_MG-2023]